MTPDPVDIHVGNRLRKRRTMLGMSQEVLARELDLSFKQIQKYEHGINRIGSSRLYEFSRLLDAPIEYFFEGAPTGAQGAADETEPDDSKVMAETLGLVCAYTRITDPGVRQQLLEITKAMADISP